MDWDDTLGVLVPRKQHTNGFNMEAHKTTLAGNMPMSTANSRFELQRQLFARSERVKGIDFHPVEPWILTTLYSGMFFGAWDIMTAADLCPSQVMSIYGHMRLRYAIETLDYPEALINPF
jgi:hypothetical protein